MKNAKQILKNNDGIALIGVLAILLVLTLFVPLLLLYGNKAVKMGFNSENSQEASYLARSGLEAAVSAYKQTWTDGNSAVETSYEKTYRLLKGTSYAKAGETAINQLDTQPMYYFKDSSGNSKYVSTTAEYESLLEDEKYEYVGEVKVVISYKSGNHVYKVKKDGEQIHLCCGYKPAEMSKATSDGTPNGAIVNSHSQSYSYRKISYGQYDFVANAKVRGQAVIKSASVIETVNADQSKWLNNDFNAFTPFNAGENPGITTGFNQVSVNPAFASSKQDVQYTDENLGGTVNGEVLVYSALGNLHISSNAKYKTYDQFKAICDQYGVENEIDEQSYQASIQYPVVLGTHPTTNLNNKKKKLLTGSDNYINTITYVNGANEQSKVLFTSTNAIQVDMPLDLSVSPCRAGGGIEGLVQKDQPSVYKFMGFQANELVFNKSILNFASFEPAAGNEPDDESGQRFGGVSISANSDTPYSYVKKDGTRVKAGKVYFKEDVYLVLVEYGDSGANLLLETDVYPNWQRIIYETGTGLENAVSDPTNGHYAMTDRYYVKNTVGTKKYGCKIVKIANAGDVYFFNSEVKSGNNNVGFNLIGYFVDTYYFDNCAKDAQNLWKTLVYHVFSKYVQSGLSGYEKIYSTDDLYYIGNIEDGSVEAPDNITEDPYVVWND